MRAMRQYSALTSPSLRPKSFLMQAERSEELSCAFGYCHAAIAVLACLALITARHGGLAGTDRNGPGRLARILTGDTAVSRQMARRHFSMSNMGDPFLAAGPRISAGGITRLTRCKPSKNEATATGVSVRRTQ